MVGVAVSKLDAKYMYGNLGTILENTNFGIKASVVRSVLDSNGVTAPSPSICDITKSELGTRIIGGDARQRLTALLLGWLRLSPVLVLWVLLTLSDRLGASCSVITASCHAEGRWIPAAVTSGPRPG